MDIQGGNLEFQPGNPATSILRPETLTNLSIVQATSLLPGIE